MQKSDQITENVSKVPSCDEKSVQLVRVASFRSDFLQNPYFRSVIYKISCPKQPKN